ncbi:NUDIX domain-containing protein [bacterium]|nr:NUDIX domain-containing protein [bacterium]
MEEVFDIVNINDEVIGSAKRSEVHGNPSLIHRVAHVLIFNTKGELFLQKRSMSKDVQPGKWDTSVGGHLDAGESYQDAALREMKEELGIAPEKIEFLYKYCHSNDYETEYVSTFFGSWNGIIWMNKDEIEEGRFWKIDEIESNSMDTQFTPNFLDELERYKKHTLSN